MKEILNLQKLEATNPTLATEGSSCTSSLWKCCGDEKEVVQ